MRTQLLFVLALVGCSGGGSDSEDTYPHPDDTGSSDTDDTGVPHGCWLGRLTIVLGAMLWNSVYTAFTSPICSMATTIITAKTMFRFIILKR